MLPQRGGFPPSGRECDPVVPVLAFGKHPQNVQQGRNSLCVPPGDTRIHIPVWQSGRCFTVSMAGQGPCGRAVWVLPWGGHPSPGCSSDLISVGAREVLPSPLARAPTCLRAPPGATVERGPRGARGVLSITFRGNVPSQLPPLLAMQSSPRPRTRDREWAHGGRQLLLPEKQVQSRASPSLRTSGLLCF